MTRKPKIHDLFATPRSGQMIEALSFETIDCEAPSHDFSASQWEVVRRMIHTTGDFSIMESVRFSSDAISAGIKALKAGRPLYVDSNMIRSGLSLARLRRACDRYESSHIHCYVADDGVAHDATRLNLPRSLLAVRKAKSLVDGAIVVFGNAPTALLELNRLIIEESVSPALVIAAPVGFVHVEESKKELLELDVPHIALAGRPWRQPYRSERRPCALLAGRRGATGSQTREAVRGTLRCGHSAWTRQPCFRGGPLHGARGRGS